MSQSGAAGPRASSGARVVESDGGVRHIEIRLNETDGRLAFDEREQRQHLSDPGWPESHTQLRHRVWSTACRVDRHV